MFISILYILFTENMHKTAYSQQMRPMDNKWMIYVMMNVINETFKLTQHRNSSLSCFHYYRKCRGIHRSIYLLELMLASAWNRINQPDICLLLKSFAIEATVLGQAQLHPNSPGGCLVSPLTGKDWREHQWIFPWWGIRNYGGAPRG